MEPPGERGSACGPLAVAAGHSPRAPGALCAGEPSLLLLLLMESGTGVLGARA